MVIVVKYAEPGWRFFSHFGLNWNACFDVCLRLKLGFNRKYVAVPFLVFQELSSIVQDLKRVEQQLLGMNLIAQVFLRFFFFYIIMSIFLSCVNSNWHDGGPRWYFGCTVKYGCDQSSDWPKAQPRNPARATCVAPWSWSFSIWSTPSLQARRSAYKPRWTFRWDRRGQMSSRQLRNLQLTPKENTAEQIC